MPIPASFLSTRRVPTRPSARFRSSQSAEVDPSARIAQRTIRIPFGVVGMLVLVVVIECFVGRNWLGFSDPVSLSWRFSAEAARTEAADSQVLCLGDSLVKHGLVPSVIEQQSGYRARNLSAARAPTLMTYFLLRRALDAGSRPDAIIINAKPAVLIGGPEFNARYFEEILTFREWIELCQITRKSSLMVSMLVGRLLPSRPLSHGDPIQPAVGPARRDRPAPLHESHPLAQLDGQRRGQHCEF